jgi:hypothetical protein
MNDVKKKTIEAEATLRRKVSAESIFGSATSDTEERIPGLGDLWQESIDELRSQTYENLFDAHAALKTLVIEKLKLSAKESTLDHMSALLAHPEIEEILRRELKIKK